LSAILKRLSGAGIASPGGQLKGKLKRLSHSSVP
jgi:hypothetical protein